MTQNNALQGLLQLIVPPELEEVLVDFLLQQNAVSGFTSSHVSGHGTSNGAVKLSLVEQVTGRQHRVQFMLHATLPVLQDLITVLKHGFQNADIHYILQPILETGSI
jgi:nitrogen regulatory protein PII